MKNLHAFIFFLLLSTTLFAQSLTRQDYDMLRAEESSMKLQATKIIAETRLTERFKADSIFTRSLVRSLKVKNSFSYPFDSLITISQLYAPDSAFRIFTWQLVINENLVRQHGAIQIRTKDGSLKLFPLIDKSDVTINIADTIGNNYGWMGAVYYKIISTKYLDHTYYTLLGFDGNSIRSDRKFIEVLSFVNEEPVFGGHYFSIPNGQLKAKNPARYIMEFKKMAGPRLNYDEELKMIVMEHLVAESGDPSKKYNLVGDGDYEGFKWTNGKWVYVSKLFSQVTPEEQLPVPDPVQKGKQQDPARFDQPTSTPKKKG